MLNSVGRAVILVKDYDEAIEFYKGRLGFETIVDQPAGDRRYVHLRLPGEPGIGIWLLTAETEEQLRHVGRQTAGQPCLVIYTDDLYGSYAELSARNVRFVREPKEEGGAIFAHFEDLYGNEIVLVQLPKYAP
jgi:catechol 2,3-dioxygenase-like lactoylglutathione lyase family enzyme